MSTRTQGTQTSFNIRNNNLFPVWLKDMEEVSKASSAYQVLETLLAQKNPLHRSQQIKDYEAKLIADQQQSVPSASEKARVGSSLRSISKFVLPSRKPFYRLLFSSTTNIPC